MSLYSTVPTGVEVHTARQVQLAPFPSSYLEFFRHSGVTSLECNKGGNILKGKDLGLRRREAAHKTHSLLSTTVGKKQEVVSAHGLFSCWYNFLI